MSLMDDLRDIFEDQPEKGSNRAKELEKIFDRSLKYMEEASAKLMDDQENSELGDIDDSYKHAHPMAAVMIEPSDDLFPNASNVKLVAQCDPDDGTIHDLVFVTVDMFKGQGHQHLSKEEHPDIWEWAEYVVEREF